MNRPKTTNHRGHFSFESAQPSFSPASSSPGSGSVPGPPPPPGGGGAPTLAREGRVSQSKAVKHSCRAWQAMLPCQSGGRWLSWPVLSGYFGGFLPEVDPGLSGEIAGVSPRIAEGAGFKRGGFPGALRDIDHRSLARLNTYGGAQFNKSCSSTSPSLTSNNSPPCRSHPPKPAPQSTASSPTS